MTMAFGRSFVFSFVALLFVLMCFNYQTLLIPDISERRQSYSRVESNGIPPFSEHSVRIYIGVVSILIPVYSIPLGFSFIDQ